MGWPEPVLISGLLATPFAFLLLFLCLRHVWLALLAALAPWPGLLLAQWALGLFYPGGYAFGFSLALLMSIALLQRLLSGAGDWRPVAWAGLGAAAAATQFYWAAADQLPVGYLLGWEMPLLLLLTGLSAGGLVLWGWRFLPFDEDFITRANRATEARARALEFTGEIATPRWALVLSGIGAVMAVLAWFELPPDAAPGIPGFVVIAATGFLISRDWRVALAGALCAALLWLFHLEAALSFFALPALFLGGAARGKDEGGASAWRLALEEWAAPLMFALAGAVLLMAMMAEIPFWLTGLSGAITALTALVFFPALTAALWRLFPRYRSIEELYHS